MPLTPNQVKQRQKEQYQKDWNALLARIDAALVAGRTTFVVPDFIEPKFVNRVLETYAEANWLVMATGDDMDGGGPTTKITLREKPETV